MSTLTGMSSAASSASAARTPTQPGRMVESPSSPEECTGPGSPIPSASTSERVTRASARVASNCCRISAMSSVASWSTGLATSVRASTECARSATATLR